MSQFSDRPFAVGSVVGIRAFTARKLVAPGVSEVKISANGTPLWATLAGTQFGPEIKGAWRLYGPVKGNEPFEPGENVARCHADLGAKFRAKRQDIRESARQKRVATDPSREVGQGEYAVVSQEMAEQWMSTELPESVRLLSQRFLEHYQVPVPLPVQERPRCEDEMHKMLAEVEAEEAAALAALDEEERGFKGNHVVGQLDCTCGYYAYLNGRYTEHASSHHPMGIIEGYGVVTIGERGFRASKARLLCLIGSDTPPHIDMQEEMRRGVLGWGKYDGTSYVPPGLAEEYGVPVFATIEEAIREFPLTEPDEPEVAEPDPFR